MAAARRPVRQTRARYTETGWEVFPQGLTDTLVWVKKRYGNPPIYITENGAAFFDPPVAEGGRVEDPLRVDYCRKHLKAVHAAMPRRGRARLLRVVAARQLRVVARLLEALRHRARRLRDAEAHAEGRARISTRASLRAAEVR